MLPEFCLFCTTCDHEILRRKKAYTISSVPKACLTEYWGFGLNNIIVIIMVGGVDGIPSVHLMVDQNEMYVFIYLVNSTILLSIKLNGCIDDVIEEACLSCDK